jgi:xylulokinase
MQSIGNITGIEQHIPAQQIGASYGDAFLAGVGMGLFSGKAEASRWVKTGQVVQPDPVAHRKYEDHYRLYRELYTHTAPLMRQVSGLQRG